MSDPNLDTTQNQNIKRTQILFDAINQGWELVPETGGSNYMSFTKDKSIVSFGEKESFPIISGMTITVQNRMASIQLAGQSHPVKQFTGGVRKDITLSLVGPGSAEDSGIAAVHELFEDQIEKGTKSKLYRKAGAWKISNELINAFDILKVLPGEFQISKSDISSTSATMTLQDVSSSRRNRLTSQKIQGKIGFLSSLIGRLLDDMNLDITKEAQTIIDSQKAYQKNPDKNPLDYHNNTSLNSLSRYETILFDAMFTWNDEQNNTLGATQDSLYKIITDSWQKETLDNGTLGSIVLQKTKLPADLNTKELNINPGEDPRKTVQTMNNDAKFIRDQIIELRAKGIDESDLIDMGNKATTLENKAKEIEATYNSYLKAGLQPTGTFLSTLVSYGDTEGKTLSGKLMQYFSDTKIQEIVSIQQYNDLKDQVPGFYLTSSPAYDHLNLPPDPMINVEPGLNPDFFFAPYQEYGPDLDIAKKKLSGDILNSNVGYLTDLIDKNKSDYGKEYELNKE